jgi:hypothetical protein
MATELPHVEDKDGDVWIDGVSYTPMEADTIYNSIRRASIAAGSWRQRQLLIIRAAADRMAHDSERDMRPSELNEGETEQ